MNGNDLLRAMSLVDEKYVDEAENKRLKRRLPVGWLSAAACLCILIGGALFLLQPQVSCDSAVTENAAANDKVMDETPVVTEAVMETQNSMESPTCALTDDPFVYIRIQAWTEDGFTGLVECEPYSNAFADGTELTVRFDENTGVMIPVEDGVQHWEDRWPTAEDFSVGTLVCIEFRSVMEDGSIVAAVISAAEEG